MTIKSMGARGQTPTGLNINPSPNLNNTPPIKINSPRYIAKIVAAAITAGTNLDMTGLLAYNNPPAYAPAVTPNRIKNMLISQLEIAEIFNSPVR